MRRRALALAALLALSGAGAVATFSGALGPAEEHRVVVELPVYEKEFKVFGTTFKAWTFNGTVPGPVIRIPLGTHLTIRLLNGHSEPHSFHTHFQHYGMANDGSSHTFPTSLVPHQADDLFGALGLTYALGLGGTTTSVNPLGAVPQPRMDHDVAMPGEVYEYHFYAGEVGTFVYHCHVFPVAEHIGRGLMGMIIVYPPGWSWEPATTGGQSLENGNTDAWVTSPDGTRYFEDVVILSELDLSTVTEKAAVETTHRAGKVQLVNFRTWADPYYLGPVEDGTPMRVIVANLGNEYHSWHIHAHNFDVLDKFDPQKRVVRRADVQVLGPGESYETVLVAREPGFWFVHDHSITAAYQGMIAWLHVLDPQA